MDAFSLLKYWRGSGGGGATRDGGGANVRTATTTIATAVNHHAAAETDEEDDGGDDGPFFDLEFSVPDEDDEEREGEEREDDMECDGTDGDENERELQFTLSSGSSGDCTDPNASLSPSDDLFFNGRLIPVEPSSIVFNGPEPNTKPQFSSLLKSATKFRVLMLKLKKSKPNAAEKTEPEGSKPPEKVDEAQIQKPEKQSKLFTVKFKVEEVPIVSLFTRDNSKSQKQQSSSDGSASSSSSSSDEKRFSKEVMQKYLKMVKPLYIRVSKRYGEKLRFSGQLSLGGGVTKAETPPPPPHTASEAQKSPQLKESPAKNVSEKMDGTESQVIEKVKSENVGDVKSEKQGSNLKIEKQGNFPARLRVVCKHLGKSRSASSAVAAAPPPTAADQARRRDDSLLQQQDGIQSAILHCKRSFNASRDSESSLLSRSVSDPSPKNPST